MRKRTASRVWVAMSAIVLVGFAVCADADEGAKPVELPGIEQAYEAAADGVYIGGQPNKETLEALAKKDVKVVINLRRPEEMAKFAFGEKAEAEALGMKYISVPMGTGLPKDAEVKVILDALANGKNEKVFIHCASSNRAGAMWALYYGVNKGQPVDAAIEEGKKAGLNNAALEHTVRNRIIAATKN